MRQFLFVLFLLASLPAAAKAVPYAEYDPATGDITIREISEIGGMFIRSASGSLNPNVLSAPVELTPTNAPLPMIRLDSLGLTISERGPFQFTSLTIRGAYVPGTPVTDVLYLDTYRVTATRQGAVVEVPEPATMTMIGLGACASLVLGRKRKG